MLPSDPRWWEFNDEPKWSVLAVGLGIIGIFYAAAGLVGLVQEKFRENSSTSVCCSRFSW